MKSKIIEEKYSIHHRQNLSKSTKERVVRADILVIVFYSLEECWQVICKLDEYFGVIDNGLHSWHLIFQA